MQEERHDWKRRDKPLGVSERAHGRKKRSAGRYFTLMQHKSGGKSQSPIPQHPANSFVTPSLPPPSHSSLTLTARPGRRRRLRAASGPPPPPPGRHRRRRLRPAPGHRRRLFWPLRTAASASGPPPGRSGPASLRAAQHRRPSLRSATSSRGSGRDKDGPGRGVGAARLARPGRAGPGPGMTGPVRCVVLAARGATDHTGG
jgi:hypothetical protein